MTDQPKPILAYDGDCGFCKRWVRRWESITGDRIEYRPFQEVSKSYEEISAEEFRAAVHLIEPDGTTFRGAEAVFRTLAKAPGHGGLFLAYRFLPGFSVLTEFFYRRIASRRVFYARVSNLLWGSSEDPPSNRLASWLYLRLLGLAYFCAFISMWVQVEGIIGKEGILPASDLLERARDYFGSDRDLERLWRVPTVFWMGTATDPSLHLACAAGTVFSIVLMIGWIPNLAALLLWFLYLSIVTVSTTFLSFQWDNLLLEAGLLAVFLTTPKIWPRLSKGWRVSPSILWLYRWLLFRLMFSSGYVKIRSESHRRPNTWQDLTALTYHYETQPLPTAFAWYAHQLPVWFHQVSCFLMFVIQLAVPFLIFFPRRPRHWGAGALILLQILILATGNYCFFNLLAIAFCALLFDDLLLKRFFPKHLRHPDPPSRNRKVLRIGWRFILSIFVPLILSLSAVEMWGTLRRNLNLPRPLLALHELAGPLRSVNSYGLFASMTLDRPEIIVQGSHDQKEWLDYEFRYKPGDLYRAPVWAAPHQPRLDWQMWFAALGNYRANPWFSLFLQRLLEGSEPVLDLLKTNPFPESPPRYVRAVVYQYHFTSWEAGHDTGAWWRREDRRIYHPTMSLSEGK